MEVSSSERISVRLVCGWYAVRKRFSVCDPHILGVYQLYIGRKSSVYQPEFSRILIVSCMWPCISLTISMLAVYQPKITNIVKHSNMFIQTTAPQPIPNTLSTNAKSRQTTCFPVPFVGVHTSIKPKVVELYHHGNTCQHYFRDSR